MELPALFSKFIKDINPTESMRADLIRGHQNLRERISRDERLSKIFVTSFLQGSYRRATLVRPKGENRSDVDVVVVTNLDSHGVGPQSALDRFRPFLDQWYPGKHCAQGRSWGIELSYCDLDLVVTSLPSAAAREVMPGLDEDSTLEDTTAWTLESNAEPLRIPDRKADRWIETHPIAQLQWTRAKNQRSNGNYLNVVKALKWWRRLHDQPKHPKGYPLEHLIGDCCPDGIKSVAEGVTLTLEAIASRYASEIATGSVPTFWDRGVYQNVFKRITAQDFKAFHTMAASAAKLARLALDQPDPVKSAHAWRQLFGDKFPLA
jgi:Second Messenger Oligonucleotide or Dinucleotide Synthetase domain